MEKQESAGKTDNPETVFPSHPSPTPDVHDEIGSATGNSVAADARRPVLGQRLAEAFREGVASARPDYEQLPDVDTPPRIRKDSREASDAGGIRGRIIQEGGSAAAVVADKAAGALGAFARLAKKAPSLTQKYAAAFRAGAASVQPREGGVRREEGPEAKAKRATADGRAILERVLKAGASAAGFVREAVSVVKPGEVIGARQKIRLGQKKINQLYIDIGGEAANSWSGGIVETEKLAALLDELRKNEEEILTIQAQLAEVAGVGKKAAAGRQQTVKKEAAFTAAADQEDSRADAGDSDATSDEPVDQPLIDDLEEGALPEPENSADVAPGSNMADLSVSVATYYEAPESHFVSEDKVDTEAAPPEEAPEEVNSETEPALPEEPTLEQEKKQAQRKDKKGRGNDG